jgi:predicted ATPase
MTLSHSILAPKRLALVGAGGTGKSTVLQLFEKHGFKVFPSIAREFYRIQGFTGENDYLALSVKDKIKFQHGMREYYTSQYADFIGTYPEANTIADRTIFDHTAYGILGLDGPDGLTVQDIERLRYTAVVFANQRMYTHIVFMPYPQPWMFTTSIEDGFRNTSAAKNFAVSSIMLNLLVYSKVVMHELKPNLLMVPTNGKSAQEIFNDILEEINPTITRVYRNLDPLVKVNGKT